MLGTPNSGSEIADRLKNFGPYRAFFGPEVTTYADVVVPDALLGRN